jgi:hypothetical protein
MRATDAISLPPLSRADAACAPSEQHATAEDVMLQVRLLLCDENWAASTAVGASGVTSTSVDGAVALLVAIPADTDCRHVCVKATLSLLQLRLRTAVCAPFPLLVAHNDCMALSQLVSDVSALRQVAAACLARACATGAEDVRCLVIAATKGSRHALRTRLSSLRSVFEQTLPPAVATSSFCRFVVDDALAPTAEDMLRRFADGDVGDLSALRGLVMTVDDAMAGSGETMRNLTTIRNLMDS